jgi:hypothetical protein
MVMLDEDYLVLVLLLVLLAVLLLDHLLVALELHALKAIKDYLDLLQVEILEVILVKDTVHGNGMMLHKPKYGDIFDSQLEANIEYVIVK